MTAGPMESSKADSVDEPDVRLSTVLASDAFPGKSVLRGAAGHTFLERETDSNDLTAATGPRLCKFDKPASAGADEIPASPRRSFFGSIFSGLNRTSRALARRTLRMPVGPRRYLPSGMSVDAFLALLTAKDVSYVVLRWFDTLPEIARGEDIDLLVADDDLGVVERLLSSYRPLRPTQPVDLYSVSGLPGTSFRGVTYFPKALGARILRNAVLINGKYKVPSPKDHFDSLAFHAVFHKGGSSGLPLSASEGPSSPAVDHDYRATLESLVPYLPRPVELSLNGLLRYFSEEGLCPKADTLERYQTKNSWLRAHQAASRTDIGDLDGLIVFVVREAAANHIREIRRTIESYGFEVIHALDLTEEQRKRVGESVRGGNWGRGRYGSHGGGPASLLIAYDYRYEPTVTPDGQLLNRRSFSAKYMVRDLIGRRSPDQRKWYNPMHASDNGWQSLEYLEALEDSQILALVERRIGELKKQIDFPYPVQGELLGQSRRARVAVVDHPVHGKTVAKVFLPNAGRFFERELLARRELGELGHVPELLDHGDNWFVTPLYAETRAHARRVLPGTEEVQLTYKTVAAAMNFVMGLRKKGYFLLDLSSHNLMSDPDRGLLIMDFEFLYKYPGEILPIEQDYTLNGVPKVGEIDQPNVSNDWERRVKKTVFHPAISGISYSDFQGRAPQMYLRAKMWSLQTYWYAVFIGVVARKRIAANRLASAVLERVRASAVLSRGKRRRRKRG